MLSGANGRYLGTEPGLVPRELRQLAVRRPAVQGNLLQQLALLLAGLRPCLNSG